MTITSDNRYKISIYTRECIVGMTDIYNYTFASV